MFKNKDRELLCVEFVKLRNSFCFFSHFLIIFDRKAFSSPIKPYLIVLIYQDGTPLLILSLYKAKPLHSASVHNHNRLSFILNDIDIKTMLFQKIKLKTNDENGIDINKLLLI